MTDATPQLLRPDMPLRVGDADARITSMKGTAERPILRLDIAADRTAAEALRGRELIVVGAEKPPLEADEYPAEDLEGCAVVTTASAPLGTVKRMLAYPSCELLELDDGTLVPLVRDCIVEVDVAGKRITVNGEFLGAA